jgi:hypothetical protein
MADAAAGHRRAECCAGAIAAVRGQSIADSGQRAG